MPSHIYISTKGEAMRVIIPNLYIYMYQGRSNAGQIPKIKLLTLKSTKMSKLLFKVSHSIIKTFSKKKVNCNSYYFMLIIYHNIIKIAFKNYQRIYYSLSPALSLSYSLPLSFSHSHNYHTLSLFPM